MHEVFLGIGGNIGNKKYNFLKTYILIQNRLGKIQKVSSVYETPPWGFKSDDLFWNMVIKIECRLSPEGLIKEIRSIENSFNRERTERTYISRKIDIDILYYDNLVTDTKNLIIPHPRLPERLFVLAPLSEIAPSFKHPSLRLTNRELLNKCKDESVIKKICTL